MSTPEDQNQQAYAQGYHVGYQHGLQAARGGGGPTGGGPTGGGSLIGGPPADYPINVLGHAPERSSRLLMFFWFIRPFLLIPHLFVLWFLGIGAFFCWIAAWFAVVITGQYPQVLWEYQLAVVRLSSRVNAYMLCLSDKYPPFSLN